MYFPYLYGKAAELLALRELAAGLGAPQVIWPVVEPTKAFQQLKITLQALKAEGNAVYLVVNPSKGDLNSASAATVWHAGVAAEISDPTVVRPTFLVSGLTSVSDLRAFVSAYRTRQIGIVLASNDISPSDLVAALAGTAHTVFLGTHVNRVAYVGALGAGATVDLEDNFVPQARNADYSGSDTQGTNHLTWASQGKAGFGDYTVLPAAYSDSGGPMGALAIHLTYETPTELRLQHFISTTVSQTAPMPPKFAEAISEMRAQIAATPTRFRASPSIAAYVAMHATGVYTSAERNKRLQIIHHLYTVGKTLGI